ncbi:family 2 encapsulin nanocompartment cargo protein polyprenyl transferase [Lentzea nigeriaca]|uniref:family 2 encapsulin nanocompartment cargo protein polyprenyl transferase n=1 Tax=Lentzea nigeriaca TaxID=1128665 RepID=UPI0019587509|nr:family 2 encapsulin nanocompartment cargo protein polyprenyl transferase [Lentzea nigeriaca]MBM7856282.1 geranylgeranyl diphosphate synthase type I [Lentzea nigeriaca]
MSAHSRSASAVLAWSRDLVQPGLRDAVDRLPPAIRRIAGYHLGWWDEHGSPATAPTGKAIRPALTLLCAESAGAAAEVALPAAVAVELAHNFSLLHDDLLDGDHKRRHRPTAWTVFGINGAILTGDALLALASDVLADSAHPSSARVLTTTVIDLVDGEHTDLAFEQYDDVSVQECEAMVERKTASLLAASCALGGIFAGGDPVTVTRLSEFGRLLGMAYQHVDDLLGIWGDPAVTGKPVHTDLASRKKSLPVVAALASGTPAGHELADWYRLDRSLGDDCLTHLARLVEEAGGRAWCESETKRLMDEALLMLSATAPAPRPAAELSALADLLVCRAS